jgi:hypothetical protein
MSNCFMHSKSLHDDSSRHKSTLRDKSKDYSMSVEAILRLGNIRTDRDHVRRPHCAPLHIRKHFQSHNSLAAVDDTLSSFCASAFRPANTSPSHRPFSSK